MQLDLIPVIRVEMIRPTLIRLVEAWDCKFVIVPDGLVGERIVSLQ